MQSYTFADSKQQHSGVTAGAKRSVTLFTVFWGFFGFFFFFWVVIVMK